jgi:branched-chain amino acid transport system substrate-binding protein
MNVQGREPSRRSLRSVPYAVLATIVLVSGACGTRVRESAEAATSGTADPAAFGPTGSADSSVASAGAGKVAPGGSPIPVAPGTVAPRPSVQQIGAPAPGGSAGKGAGGSDQGSRTGTTPGGVAPAADFGSQPGAQAGGDTRVPTGPSAPVGAQPGSPVTVASVGTYSGPVGTVNSPILRGAQVWVKWINQRGGLNGHQIVQVVYDDGGDPARYRAAVHDAVERRKVLAFLINSDVVTGNSREVVDYITANRVPVIGLDGGPDVGYASPMYFPHLSSGQYLERALVYSTAEQSIPKGLKKLGTLVCVEGQICSSIERRFADMASEVGFDYVYHGKASLAQPDFTAECLAAHNDAVEVLFLAMDQNSSRRLSAACARQGYHPVLALPGQGIAEDLKNDPNLDGTIGSVSVFPWFQKGTPATDEYQEALKVFGTNEASGAGPAIGWSAAKLFERGGAALAEPPTRESLLAGLAALRSETLGGLVAPLTFQPNTPPTPFVCWFSVVLKDRVWRSPDNYRLHCH